MAEANRVTVDPHVHRRRLQSAVRQARLDAGKTQPEVAAALDWSLSKVVRIESGAVRVSLTDLRALLDYYGIRDTARVEGLLEEARAARRPAWWSDYESLLGREFTSYLGFEGSATLVRQFQAGLVPGLLQTESYARAVLTALRAPEHVDQLVEARRRRQRLLDRANPPRFVFVIDEAALRRRIGGPAGMLDQLRRLDAVARRPNVSVLALPLDVGAHAGLGGSFVLLDVGDEQVAYLEDGEGGLLRRDAPAVTDDYLARFRKLENVAEPVESILSRLIQEISVAAQPAERLR